MLRATQFPHNLPNRSDATGLSFGRFLFWVRALLGARHVAALTALLLFTGCAPRRAQAQFIGYTSPQSNQQTLANTVTCTGSPQNFVVNNFGQVFHQSQRTSIVGATNFFMVIQGSTDGVNFSNISDVANAPSPGQDGIGTSANGYYPVVRVQVVCGPGTATFSLSYSGIAGAAGIQAGTVYLASTSKFLFRSISAGTSASTGTLQTPFDNSAGIFLAQISAAGFPAGSSISVQCIGLVGTQTTFTFPMTAANGTFAYAVPPTQCPTYTLFYTSGGASASILSIEYDFSPLGSLAGQQMLYSPAMLGVSAITEPAAGTSALSNIVDTRGARQGTLSFVCTAGNVTLNVQEYAEDGSTTLALVSPLSAVGAAANAQLTFGSESNPSSNVGTLSTSALVRLPQRAMAFSFTNAGGAGTCTARLFLAY